MRKADGRDFLLALRLYGTVVEFYDQSWKPEDVMEAKQARAGARSSSSREVFQLSAF